MADELNTDTPGNFNASHASHAGPVQLRAASGLAPGARVFYILNLGTHWETRGPAEVAALHDDGCRVQLGDQPHGWFDPKHIFKRRLDAVVAADQLTQAIRRSTNHGRTG